MSDAFATEWHEIDWGATMLFLIFVYVVLRRE